MSLAENVFPLVMRNIKFVGYHRELSTFSPALSCPKTVNSALPSDFVAFLIWKDQGRMKL